MLNLILSGAADRPELKIGAEKAAYTLAGIEITGVDAADNLLDQGNRRIAAGFIGEVIASGVTSAMVSMGHLSFRCFFHATGGAPRW